MKKQIGMISVWLAVLIWMAFIFFLSAQPATVSNEVSSGVAVQLVRVISIVFSMDFEAATGSYLESVNFFLRKLAHAFAYFVLAVLMVRALQKSGLSGRKVFVAAFVFVCCMPSVMRFTSCMYREEVDRSEMSSLTVAEHS
jgi:VanZ family protein